MPGLPRGLYEQLLTEALAARLEQVDARGPLTAELRAAEAADRIALHVARIVERAVASESESNRVVAGLTLARRLLAQIDAAVSEGEAPVDPGSILRSVRSILPDGSPEDLAEPLIPLLDTILLTNAPGEPRVGSQLLTEIASADGIDVLMAFIRRSGIAPLLDALREHREHGRKLRVLTTTYTGSTEGKALDQLRAIGAEVRVSYDTSTTRLHAKAWLFHRRSGFSTAYIGSSNLTHSAQVTGLEWNVRVSGARNASVVDKVSAVFESYWESGDFVPYEAAEFAERVEQGVRSASSILLSPLEVRLEPFQERMLEKLAFARERGRHKNLLVSATGTGKTVMAAVDYARLRGTLPRGRLLFVAHRKEILTQAQATFRYALRDAAFGELWVGGSRPRRFEHVFASIQSLGAADLADLDPEHFDVVIVDEFHHAAARSYRDFLDHIRPRELLGLTATPERSDGLPVLDWFDGRIAAELRLWDAIDQHRLSPFVYYGIHDGLDLRDVPWRRGRGYDVEGLSNLLTANDVWAKRVIKQLLERIDEPGAMRALGFCVSIEHARFMARVFNEAGIRATAVWADSPMNERIAALADLAARRVNAVFSVDLFNEGIDVPVVDTVLFLRPTDSPTLFLQQLGRGLRRSADKNACTVLDFVGQHRREFRFERRFRALLGGTRRDLLDAIDKRFPFLPAGCHMELDAVAREIVLENIRQGIPSQWSAKVEALAQLAGAKGAGVTLAQYLDDTDLDLDDVFVGDRTWSDLREAAGLPVAASGPHESVLRRAIGRLLHVDDVTRIDGYRRLLSRDEAPAGEELSERDRRLLRMLVASIAGRAIDKSASLDEASSLLWSHPQVRAELLELLALLAGRVDRVHPALSAHPDVPLSVHGRYSRVELLAAFGVGEGAKVAAWQTGVRYLKAQDADLLAFTLDKTSGQFSPTTRYRDYAISRDLIHWESQSAVREASATGVRYQNHAGLGSSIFLFARLRTDDRAFWFLGPASYVRHESECPMAITWRLHFALPGDLFTTFAAAVA